MTRSALLAGDLAPEDLYGDLYTEEGITDQLQSLSVHEVHTWITRALAIPALFLSKNCSMRHCRGECMLLGSDSFKSHTDHGVQPVCCCSFNKKQLCSSRQQSSCRRDWTASVLRCNCYLVYPSFPGPAIKAHSNE